MGVDGAAEVARGRGRVVMLVDNGVNGDSRVQKSARSAAEAGWDVVLLGRSPDGNEHSWRLGDAEVRLLPMPTPLYKRRHDFHRPFLPSPLAYPPTGVAAYKRQRVRAWRADLSVRQAALTMPTSAGRAGATARLALRAELFAAKVVGRWVALRSESVTVGRRFQRKLDNRIDPIFARFWRAVRGDRAWRKLEPTLWDYELAYADVIDELQPDLIHANDFRMLGVGARAKIRAHGRGRPVKLVWDAHEYLPGVKPWRDNGRWLPAHICHEREYAPYADAAVTVSDSLAELLQKDHNLVARPAVVLNAPAAEHGPADADDTVPDLRALCGIGHDVPLLVYSGAAAKQRGLDIMVEALPQLPGVHVAFVVNKPTGPYLGELTARATELGVADRVHSLPYVSHWHVVPFLAAADAGVIPIHHWPNHEIALITKYFEYSHARLPMIVSDVRTMAATTRETGNGEVFTAENIADYVRAVRAVLADPARYRAAYDKPGLLETWTWQAQAQILDEVYSRLLPGRTPTEARTSGARAEPIPAADPATVPGNAPAGLEPSKS